MAKRYKLRAQLIGHEKDVRAVCPAIFPAGAVISASRDVTARVWAQNEHDAGFTEGLCMSGHGNFVAAVVAMPPDDNYPQGLIFTGSYDHNIFAYTLDSPQPQFKLTGHTNSVCALAVGKFGTLLSGSWDTTAKVWLNKKCVMTLEGHEAAVWAVAVIPQAGIMLTGSADKTIKLWRAGKAEHTFLGHTDCVRGLAVINASEFLSCSNDASIRRWLITGESTHTYFGHTNFVYSIALLPNGEDFVTGGEDRTLRVWQQGECTQTIAHPTQSIWSVCVLPNGDIVTGASDGLVRVFTAAPEREADAEQQAAFEEMVSKSTIPTQVGDIKTEDLPGPQALLNPGKKDGQTLMVKNGDIIEAHNWSAAEGRWIKIGDVVGASGGSQQTSGKVLYEGKEYDYVFDVDLDEGAALKLPYNLSEDPWHAAQRFIHKNELSQLFLDQIANFIVQNTKQVTLGQQTQTVSDPFTGGGRYVPDAVAGGAPAQQMATSNAADPFTGSGSYRPSAATAPAAEAGQQAAGNQYFPKTDYLTFEAANTSAITGKLRELNMKAPEGQKLTDAEVEQLEQLLNGTQASAPVMASLWKALHWPKDLVFPALDILRIAIKSKEVNEYLCGGKDGTEFLNHILSYVSRDDLSANQMLSLRVLTNCFAHGPGQKLVGSKREEILSSASACCAGANKNIQIAISSLLLNYSVMLYHSSDTEAKSQCINILKTVFDAVSDPEANFRLLVTTGTLIWGDSNSIALTLSADIQENVTKLSFLSEPKKVSECAKLVVKCLQSL